jgi:hypothetical protein
MKWIYVVKFPKSAGEKSWMNEKAVLLTVKAIIDFFLCEDLLYARTELGDLWKCERLQ